MANNRLDFVIFGATGFTGKYTVKEAARLATERQLKFGISGRRKEALQAVAKEFAPDIEDIPIIVADLQDEESLKKMSEQAKVVVNCCGPYRFYGEPLIKACIATRTHHVDVSGEPQYMEKMQLEYNKAAQEAGIYIVSACGFDSIPCDLGVVFVQDKFQGEVSSVEIYLKNWRTPNVVGPEVHYGTWESAVYGLAHSNELRGIRTKLFPKRLPTMWPRLKTRSLIHRSSVSEGWSTIFPSADRSIVRRSQQFFFEKYKQRPVQVQTYVTFNSLLAVLATSVVALMFLLLSKIEFGRSLLLKYPSFFSGGFASRDGPKPEVMENSHFSFTFKAEGWTEKLAEPTDKHSTRPNKQLVAKVTGVNPAYGATCVALLLCAMTILKESDKMPDNGGVFPPGAAFAKTSLIEECNKNGLKYEVLSSVEK